MALSDLIQSQQQAWTAFLRLAIFEHWLTEQARHTDLIPTETVLAAYRRRLSLAASTNVGHGIGKFFHIKGRLLYIAGYALSQRHKECFIAETLQGDFLPLSARSTASEEKTWQEVDAAIWHRALRRIR